MTCTTPRCECYRNETTRWHLSLCSQAVCERYFCRDIENRCSSTCSQCNQTFCRDHTFGCENCDATYCFDCRELRGEQYCRDCFTQMNINFGGSYLDDEDEEEYDLLEKRKRALEERRIELESLAKKRKREFYESAEQLSAEQAEIEQELKLVDKRRRSLRNESTSESE